MLYSSAYNVLYCFVFLFFFDLETYLQILCVIDTELRVHYMISFDFCCKYSIRTVYCSPLLTWLGLTTGASTCMTLYNFVNGYVIKLGI